MLTLLKRTVPEHGPRRLLKTDMCKLLRDDIYEFRKNPRGAKIRVLWFYGTTGQSSEPLTVVCTHAFLKDTREVPPEQIEKAIKVREKYFRDQDLGKNEVYDLNDTRVR